MLPSIEPSELEDVTGGRIQRVADLDPKFAEAINGLAKAVEAAAGQIAQGKGQIAQVLQQVMQQKMEGGGGKKH